MVSSNYHLIDNRDIHQRIIAELYSKPMKDNLNESDSELNIIHICCGLIATNEFVYYSYTCNFDKDNNHYNSINVY